MALNTQDSWAALVRAATAHTKKNGSQLSQTDPKAKSREIIDLAMRSSRDLVMESYNRLPDNLKSSLQGEAFKTTGSYGKSPYNSGNKLLNEIIQTQAKFFSKARDFAWGMAHTLTDPQTAPQTPESRGQLRVDLDTSPVQTKDSVMYRNAGEGEESTIGEASRPNKRKPGLSSNLGINL